MKMDMHDIHHGAYRICTVHMWYAHTCICMYRHVLVCIWFSYDLYPVHMCMYVLKWLYSYRMIQSDMHWSRSAYLHVCECISSLHTSRYAPFFDMHICLYLTVFCVCIHSDMHILSCAYLNVSDCILPPHSCTYALLITCISSCMWLYVSSEYIHIHQNGWVLLLRQIGRPQAHWYHRGRAGPAAVAGTLTGGGQSSKSFMMRSVSDSSPSPPSRRELPARPTASAPAP